MTAAFQERMTFYVAGPMRGRPFFNFPAFDKARDYLEALGCSVISPADLDRESGFDPAGLPADHDWSFIPNGFDLHAAIDRDIAALKRCDGIYLLEGWENSRGALAEKAMAEWLGLWIMYQRGQHHGPFETRKDSPPIVIGIRGPIGSGKSSIAKRLAATQENCEVISLASPLKKMLRAAGVPQENLYGTTAEKDAPLPMLCGRNGRYAMQTLGTEWGRQLIGPRIWLNLWRHEVLKSGADLVVCDDIRFADEADEIRDMGGIVFELTGRGMHRNDDHISESDKVVPDLLIDNSGSIEATCQAICDVVFGSALTRCLLV
jgi:hypothetical protein